GAALTGAAETTGDCVAETVEGGAGSGAIDAAADAWFGATAAAGGAACAGRASSPPGGLAGLRVSTKANVPATPRTAAAIASVAERKREGRAGSAEGVEGRALDPGLERAVTESPPSLLGPGSTARRGATTARAPGSRATSISSRSDAPSGSRGRRASSMAA